MPTAKHNFLERLFIIERTLSTPNLIDGLPTQTEHNDIARLLRNGLAVVGFVALEDFIKNRTIEILNEIASSHIPFASLTEDLRFYSTVEVLKSIQRISGFESNKIDKILFVQNETKIISSSLNTSYDLNKHTFGFSNSNISKDEIKKILKSLNISDSWNKQTALASIIGITSLPLENSFTNAATRRHKAAHDTSSSIPIGDLTQYINEAIAIALTFDALISYSKSRLINDNAAFIANTTNIDHNSIALSYIKKETNKWKYKRRGRTNAVKTDSDKTNLLSTVIPIARSNNECLVIYNETNKIVD
ncbi:MAG TPA: HEPN domain-containing protein [Bacteroidia bacterium]|nr:HEPN domain-containing protein [Bacteroidia bacterium]